MTPGEFMSVILPAVASLVLAMLGYATTLLLIKTAQLKNAERTGQQLMNARHLAGEAVRAVAQDSRYGTHREMKDAAVGPVAAGEPTLAPVIVDRMVESAVAGRNSEIASDAQTVASPRLQAENVEEDPVAQ